MADSHRRRLEIKRVLIFSGIALCFALGCGDSDDDTDTGGGSGAGDGSATASDNKGDVGGSGSASSDPDTLCRQYANKVRECAGPGGEFVNTEEIYKGCYRGMTNAQGSSLQAQIARRQCFVNSSSCNEGSCN